ncbi:Vitamin B12 transporter BtuB [Porphyromonas levii]|nr:Vitamin B12 transporter BtuB [Porphyromonas levii]
MIKDRFMTKIQTLAKQWLPGMASLLMIGAPTALWAQEQVQMEHKLDELVIVGTRPGERTPITKQKIKVKALQRKTTAWDIPSLLQGTPSLITTNESGVFGGYTYFSIRGVDPTRVNITVNGVPVNDSESQTVFWANMPDFGSRLQDIVVVRGAGASSFGAGAFGATMDMQTAMPSRKAGGSIGTYWGSFGLNRNVLSLETGKLSSGWSLNGYLSYIQSKGYVDRSGGHGLSYFAQARYEADKYDFRLIHHRGIQQTGIAWNGLEPQQEEKYGRRFNPAGWINTDEADPAKHQFHNNTDNYDQSHTYAIFRRFPQDNFKYEVTLHYTRGKGFTHEYRTGRKYREYGLVPATDKRKNTLIREKYLDNHFFGGNANFGYTFSRARLSAGLSANHYIGDHYGELPYVADPTVAYVPNQEYYRNHSTRTDASIYVKGEFDLSERLMLYADVMYRHVYAVMTGSTDKWSDHDGKLDILDYKLPYHFVLPKVGLHFHPNSASNLYLSLATAGKEPNRKVYTESRQYDEEGKQIMPQPEYMADIELGGDWRYRNLSLFANLYYMHYKNQLVQNGKMSDVGEPLLINVPKSYRAGLELGFNWAITPQIVLAANGTLSSNRVLEHTHIEYNTTTKKPEVTKLNNTPLALSPEWLFNHSLTWMPIDRLSLALSGTYVGKQFLDNTGFESRALPAYYTGSFMANYAVPFSNGQELALQLQVLNLYNSTYATNGWAGGYAEVQDGKLQRKAWTGYFPAAPIHFVAGATLTF